MIDDFLKYPSLLSHMHEKEIAWWHEHYPHIKDIMFCVREKLDGANVQLLFLPDGTIKKGRRLAWLAPDEKFYNIDEAIQSSTDLIEYFTTLSKSTGMPIRVFCELHGKGINKRVYYGDKLYLTILDVVIGKDWVPQSDLYDLLINSDKFSLQQVKGFADTLLAFDLKYDDAMAFSEDFISQFAKQDNNVAEGIVIRPWNTHIHNGRGENFIIKKKSANFEERPAKLKVYEAKEYSEAQLAFKEYINESRVLAVFSKHGPITSQKQIGDYIKLVLEDAKIDFYKDFPNITEDRSLFKLAGNAVVPLLRKHL